MGNVMRVALPGYNALTDTDTDHFALYSDQDNVLIKEFIRGTVNVPTGSSAEITHNLGYIPFFAFFVDRGGGLRQLGWLYNPDSGYNAYATTSVIHFSHTDGSDHTFLYYIFYDQQV
jgi:hypothetical protein